jgi:hypothetical protein
MSISFFHPLCLIVLLYKGLSLIGINHLNEVRQLKVIFLDIDGVLVTDRHWVRSNTYSGMEFDPECVDVLQKILLHSKAKLVISSSWRESRTFYELKEVFKTYHLDGYILDVTERLDFQYHRGDEIQHYLDNHEVDKFVILDDEAIMGDLEEYTVRPTMKNGLTKQHIETILSFLKK